MVFFILDYISVKDSLVTSHSIVLYYSSWSPEGINL